MTYKHGYFCPCRHNDHGWNPYVHAVEDENGNEIGWAVAYKKDGHWYGPAPTGQYFGSFDYVVTTIYAHRSSARRAAKRFYGD